MKLTKLMQYNSRKVLKAHQNARWSRKNGSSENPLCEHASITRCKIRIKKFWQFGLAFQRRTERQLRLSYFIFRKIHIDADNGELRKNTELQWPSSLNTLQIKEGLAGIKLQVHQCLEERYERWEVDFSEIIYHSGLHHKFWVRVNAPSLSQRSALVVKCIVARKR